MATKAELQKRIVDLEAKVALLASQVRPHTTLAAPTITFDMTTSDVTEAAFKARARVLSAVMMS